MTGQQPLHAIMFADVSGSSRLYKEMGNEAAKAIVDEAIQFMSMLTIVNDGTVVKTMGDEIMARFDSCDNACETAIAIQQRCVRESQLNGLAIRIGISFGEVLITHDDVFGDTVNDAAFVAHIARAHQIVLTQSVIDDLDHSLLQACQMFDRISIKGDTVHAAIYRLQWESSRQNHRATQLMPIQEVTHLEQQHLLSLCQRDKIITLLPEQLPFHIGRDDQKSDLPVDHELVSRDHCSIEFRRGKFVLIDHSTNGTFVTREDQPDIYLRREEFPLQGDGEIGLGQSTQRAGQWLIRFHVKDVDDAS
jgi:adenylate cyclase